SSSTQQKALTATATSPAEPVRSGTDLAAARIDASRPSVDPRIPPPPRAPLAGSPDLDNAAFLVNDNTLRAMANDGVPAAVTEGLERRRARPVTNVAESQAAVEDRVGKPAADPQLGKILQHALVVTLVDPPEAPEGKAELQPAEQQKRGGKPVKGTAPQLV